MKLSITRRDLLLAGGAATLAVRQSAAAGAGGDSEGQGFLRRTWPRNQATPALDLPGFDGPRWRLDEGRGKLVLLNFWASWCEPCRTEMPTLELLAQRFEKQGLMIFAVNQRETDAAIRRFMDVMPITLPILRDTDGLTSRAWGVRAFPTSVLVNREGQAVFSVIGEMDWNGPEARQWIAALI